MLSWCPAEGALTPGGNESRGGLLPVDLLVREALEFKAKLPDYTAAPGTSLEGKAWGFLSRDARKKSSGIKIKTVFFSS